MTPKFDECNTIAEVVFQAMGFASTCWDDNNVFESDLAKEAGDAAVKRIKELKTR